MLAVLDAHAPPDVRPIGREAELGPEQVTQPFRTLGQHLVGMPVGPDHHPDDGEDLVVGDVLVEQVAHRVDEDHLGTGQPERLEEFLRDSSQVEPLLVGMAGDAPEPLGEDLGIAVGASRADLGTPPDRVPGDVGPLDGRVL